jgi:hypothetical protein
MLFTLKQLHGLLLCSLRVDALHVRILPNPVSLAASLVVAVMESVDEETGESKFLWFPVEAVPAKQCMQQVINYQLQLMKA